MNDSVSAGTFKRSLLCTKPRHAETLVFTGSSMTSEVHKRRCQFISRSAEFSVEMCSCNNMFVVTRCSEGSFPLKILDFICDSCIKYFLNVDNFDNHLAAYASIDLQIIGEHLCLKDKFVMNNSKIKI